MNYSDATIARIAAACHEANKLFCEEHNDYSQVHFLEAPKEIQHSAIDGVRFRLENPDATPASQHDNWMKVKTEQGWAYGEVKDAEAKTHPCLVPYDQLPEFQQRKDKLFQAIVDAWTKDLKAISPVEKQLAFGDEYTQQRIQLYKAGRDGSNDELQKLMGEPEPDELAIRELNYQVRISEMVRNELRAVYAAYSPPIV